ncbi:MAG: hypothetical protein IMZ62_12995 [Chloroflexi bacterium]|nr:hypothetical protein [Chloroflexota bacterium]MBE3118195.1 hypothetical protein [Candidatus Atribacteria bacterium]
MNLTFDETVESVIGDEWTRWEKRHPCLAPMVNRQLWTKWVKQAIMGSESRKKALAMHLRVGCTSEGVQLLRDVVAPAVFELTRTKEPQ